MSKANGRARAGQTCAESIRVMCPLFQAGEGGSIPTSALQLRFEEIGMREAVVLNRLWHSRLPNIDKRLGNRTCYGAHFGGVLYAVAIWTNPVCNQLPQDTWLELRRMAIAPDAPKNTASRMLGWMARDLPKRLPHLAVLVSYQDRDVHAGTIYKAAGWTGTDLPTRSEHGHWARERGRPRKSRAILRKVRWEKVLRNEAPAAATKLTETEQPSLFRLEK